MLDWYAIGTYNYVDQEHNLMLCRNPEWYQNIGAGRYDAIIRNFIAYVCYGDKRLIEGIKNCWERKPSSLIYRLLGKNYYYQGHPYPDCYDKLPPITVMYHLYYTIFALKMVGYDNKSLKEFIYHLPFKLDKKTYLSLESILWMLALVGNKFNRFLYYLYMIPKMWVNCKWNKFIYKIAPFGEESCQNSWVKIPNDLKPDRIKDLANRLYSIRELHGIAWQIYILPDSKLKKILQRICLSMTPKHNYVIKMLLGNKEGITRTKIYGYKPMYSNRWHGILNPWINDRDIDFIIDEELLEANVLDVDYVRCIYEKTK